MSIHVDPVIAIAYMIIKWDHGRLHAVDINWGAIDHAPSAQLLSCN